MFHLTKVLNVSTAHITYVDNAILSMSKMELHPSLYEVKDGGYRIYITKDAHDWLDTCATWTDHDMTDSFMKLLTLAKVLDVDEINIDKDGCIYDTIHLNLHEW